VREYLDENDTIGDIRLKRHHPMETDTVWVLLEGDSDVRLYRKLIDGNNVEVKQAYCSGGNGLTVLKKVLKTLREDDQNDRVIGIRDADFLHLNNKKENASYLFVTDCHDMEMMTIASDKAFKSIIAEHCGDCLPDYQKLRQDILRSIKFLGGIRWYNEKNACKYNFDGLGFGKYYNSETLELDQQKCVEDINQRSSNKTQDAEITEVNKIIDKVNDLLNLCNGHDFTKAFALHATMNYRQVSHASIESGLRQAYGSAEFEKTVLYESLKVWGKNSKYSLFAGE
jgi:uncharacterized protein DUF4435